MTDFSAGTGFGAPHPTIANLWVMFNRSSTEYGDLILYGYCKGAPDTTANVYDHGCIMVRLDSGTGTTSLYENTGTVASPVWHYLGLATTSSSSSSSSVSTSSSSSSSSSVSTSSSST